MNSFGGLWLNLENHLLGPRYTNGDKLLRTPAQTHLALPHR